MTQIVQQAKTLKLLIAASNKLTGAAQAAVVDELKELTNLDNMHPPRRRRLLSAFHIARGLETTLSNVVTFHGHVLPPDRRNMGGYLGKLASEALLPHTLRIDCDNRVRVLRNRLAHGAGEYPTGDYQLNSAAQAAHACIAFIL